MKFPAIGFLVLALFSAILLGAISEVSADAGLSIQPIKVSQTLKPGDEVTGFFTLTNAGNERVEVTLTVEDFVPTAGTSNINFIGRAEGVTTVRDWISLNYDQVFQFDPGEAKNIPYTIRAPANAEPGGHFGVVFFKATQVNAEGQLKVGTRVGSLVFITVPGNQLQKGKIVDFSAPRFLQKSPVPFKIKFENTGTVHYEPKGEVTIKNIFGREVGVVPVSGYAVLPTGVRDLDVEWQTEKILLGLYSASATIKDGEGNTLTTQELSFIVVPVYLILGVIVGIFVTFRLLLFIKRRVRIQVVSRD
jgi:hypothetical protein